MKHAFVAEFRQRGTRWVEAFGDGGFYGEPAGKDNNRYYIRCKFSGRLDEIRLITQETEIHGQRFNGQIVAIDDSYAVDGLLMYVRHNIDFRRRRNGALQDEDPQTLFWHWATEDASFGTRNDDRDCFTACIKSLDDAVRSRSRS